MGGHAFTAEDAGGAGCYSGYNDAVTCFEGLDGGPDGVDDGDAFVPENAAVGNGGDVAFEDVEVGAFWG